jgi:hypothetical protein
MLVRYVPTEPAVSTIVRYSLLNMYMGVSAIIIGVPITALLLDLARPIAIAVWIASGVLVTIAIVATLLVRRGALGTLLRAAARIRVISTARADRWRAKVTDIDDRMRSAGGLQRGIAGVVGSRVFNWTGTVVVLHAVGIPLTAPLVVATLSVGILVTWLTNVIPLGLGLADGTNYVLYDLLGATAKAGLLFTMVNRVRTLILATIGLSIMAVANARYRALPGATARA